jgi:hypothetical protein
VQSASCRINRGSRVAGGLTGFSGLAPCLRTAFRGRGLLHPSFCRGALNTNSDSSTGAAGPQRRPASSLSGQDHRPWRRTHEEHRLTTLPWVTAANAKQFLSSPTMVRPLGPARWCTDRDLPAILAGRRVTAGYLMCNQAVASDSRPYQGGRDAHRPFGTVSPRAPVREALAREGLLGLCSPRQGIPFFLDAFSVRAPEQPSKEGRSGRIGEPSLPTRTFLSQGPSD